MKTWPSAINQRFLKDIYVVDYTFRDIAKMVEDSYTDPDWAVKHRDTDRRGWWKNVAMAQEYPRPSASIRGSFLFSCRVAPRLAGHGNLR